MSAARGAKAAFLRECTIGRQVKTRWEAVTIRGNLGNHHTPAFEATRSVTSVKSRVVFFSPTRVGGGNSSLDLDNADNQITKVGDSYELRGHRDQLIATYTFL